MVDFTGKKFRLTKDLPINEMHGAFKGKEFICTNHERGLRTGRIFFIADSGLECAAFQHEVEWIKEE